MVLPVFRDPLVARLLTNAARRWYDGLELDIIRSTLVPSQMNGAAVVKCAELVLKRRPDFKFLWPQSYAIADAHRVKQVFKTAPRFLLIPLIVTTRTGGQHVTLLTIEKTPEGNPKSIEFFDSQGASIGDYPEVEAIADAIGDEPDEEDWKIVSPPPAANKTHLQSILDPINCGAFIVHRADQIAHQADGKTPPADIGSIGALRRRWTWANELAETLAADLPIVRDWEHVQPASPLPDGWEAL